MQGDGCASVAAAVADGSTGAALGTTALPVAGAESPGSAGPLVGVRLQAATTAATAKPMLLTTGRRS